MSLTHALICLLPGCIWLSQEELDAGSQKERGGQDGAEPTEGGGGDGADGGGGEVGGDGGSDGAAEGGEEGGGDTGAPDELIIGGSAADVIITVGADTEALGSALAWCTGDTVGLAIGAPGLAAGSTGDVPAGTVYLLLSVADSEGPIGEVGAQWLVGGAGQRAGAALHAHEYGGLTQLWIGTGDPLGRVWRYDLSAPPSSPADLEEEAALSVTSTVGLMPGAAFASGSFDPDGAESTVFSLMASQGTSLFSEIWASPEEVDSPAGIVSSAASADEAGRGLAALPIPGEPDRLVVSVPEAQMDGLPQGLIYICTQGDFEGGVEKVTLENCSTVLRGRSQAGFGRSLAVADMDGDGWTELIASEPGEGGEPDHVYALSSSKVSSGAASYLYTDLSPTTWTATMDSGLGAALLATPPEGDEAEQRVFAGAPEVAVDTNAQAGLVYLLSGLDGGTHEAADSSLIVQGVDKEERCGAALALAELDGAPPDLVVGCPGYGEKAGRVLTFIDLERDG